MGAESKYSRALGEEGMMCSVAHTGTLASLTVYCLRWRNHKIAHLEPGHFTAEQSYRFIADNSAHSLFVLAGVRLRTKTVE